VVQLLSFRLLVLTLQLCHAALYLATSVDQLFDNTG
jgi:hypothetical protein